MKKIELIGLYEKETGQIAPVEWLSIPKEDLEKTISKMIRNFTRFKRYGRHTRKLMKERGLL
jgi:hypothetical protein